MVSPGTHHAHVCPQCETGSLVLCCAVAAMNDHHATIIRDVLEGMAERRLPLPLAAAVASLTHHVGCLVEETATKAAIYALHQVVRLEDGTLSPQGGIVPMLCLACVVPDPGTGGPAASKLHHTCGK